MVTAQTIMTWLDKLPDYGVPLLRAGIIAVVGWIVAYTISKIVSHIVEKSGNVTLGKFLKQFVFYFLLLFVLFGVLTTLGVSTTSLLTILAGMSVAVGLSLRDSLSNLASGILLVLFRPFAVNDLVTIDSLTGTVTDVQLIFTYLSDSNGDIISIPNNKFMTNAVTKNAKDKSNAKDYAEQSDVKSGS